MAGQDAHAVSLTLGGSRLERTFPFFLLVDTQLQLRAWGPSLHKLLPGLLAGEALAAHFEIQQPPGAPDPQRWQDSAGELVILKSRTQPDLQLRGSVESAGDDGFIFLLTAAVSSFEQMRTLGLALKDYALHDSVAEILRSRPALEQAAGPARQLEQLRAIVEMGDSGVLYVSARGEVMYVNHVLCQMFGIDDSRIAGLTLDAFEKHVGEMLASEESIRQPVSSLLDSLLDGKSPGVPATCNRTLRLVAPKHVTLEMTLALTPAREMVFYFRDVTSQTEVDRMKSEFLSTAAHELRTPLASIFGFAELMMTRKMGPEQQKELLGTIHRQAQLLINLINELLDLSRIESRQGKDFHRQFCRVGTIVDQTIKGLLVKNDKRQVKLHMPHGAECIMVDPEKTMQALLNVLSNAFKYSPNGGDITLDTVLKEKDADRYVGIRVTDQGMGMTPEQLNRVFERFWRADPSGAIPGTGLGMSLVKEITELQEGHVQVVSVPGQGTSVTLWFPLTADFVLSRPSEMVD